MFNFYHIHRQRWSVKSGFLGGGMRIVFYKTDPPLPLTTAHKAIAL